MNLKKVFIYTALLPVILFLSVSCNRSFSETDTTSFQMISFYDLRDRESFVQVTNTSSSANKIHVQVYDVGNNCNENDFFDNLTGNDTHVYNLRDIATNDGNPAGVVLPSDAYGIVVITVVDSTTNLSVLENSLMSNFRVLDNAGYEYRTNALSVAASIPDSIILGTPEFYLNYNQKGGVTFSDIIGFTVSDTGLDSPEVTSTDILNNNILIDVDILDLNETIFSCRNVIFACTDQDNPSLDELLAQSGGASVASFEYGINEAVPHSKGGELLCPGNVIGEGVVRLRLLDEPDASSFGVYVGLNNGNGRGSMDSFWDPSVPLANAENGGVDGGGDDMLDDGGDT